ncbi:hypothetical protein BAE44_0018680 [Dichanthelium oligosanthes]|uniref:Uncharacterized protein n=1 Tax=Dichanthelium oligosanthes TaxID=888268 RepID=A0A1E5V567_9POAL|nr:hypothetical protein BAE44_0018680 [Dichanthelium oligosanthes]
MALGSTWWDETEPDAAAASKLHQAAPSTLVGLSTSSMAITLSVREPPPGIDKNAYLLALAGAFFAGVADVITAVRISNNPHARRAAGAGTKLMYASIAPLAVVVGLSLASLL